MGTVAHVGGLHAAGRSLRNFLAIAPGSRSFAWWRIRVPGAMILALGCATAMAGPVRDFETSFGEAYAEYRAALFMTNGKDAAATEKAMASLEGKWRAISERWGAAPQPQYADDASWPEVLKQLEGILGKAREEVRKGELAQAHETLEAFRDVVGALHARNNVATFSDHMNAYHAKMEEILQGRYGGFDAPGRLRLARDAAVLEYLAGNLEKHGPREAAGSAEFRALLSALRSSVGELNSAVAGGDGAAMQRALERLKPPYSRFFLRFG